MARKALGRGLDALIPNARELLTPSSTRVPARDDDDTDDDDDEIKEQGQGDELAQAAPDREGLVRLSQAVAGQPSLDNQSVMERAPAGQPPIPQRQGPSPMVGATPSAAGPA